MSNMQRQKGKRSELEVVALAKEAGFPRAPQRGGTLALSWGRYGGFYVHRARICLGWVALTRVPVEIDELMASYANKTREIA